MYNKNTKIENKPLFYITWCNKGIKYNYDHLDEDCNFLTLENIQHKINVQISHLAYTGIGHTIKLDLKNRILNETVIDMEPISHKILKHIYVQREDQDQCTKF